MPSHKSQTSLVCRNVVVSDRRTSIRMEQVMWDCMSDICRQENHSLNDLITEIDGGRSDPNLTGAIRVYIIAYFRNVASRDLSRYPGFSEAGLDQEAFDYLAENGPSAQPGNLVRMALDVLGPAHE
jgi:predicted DNA-binding ribbon-helix-helix protein